MANFRRQHLLRIRRSIVELEQCMLTGTRRKGMLRRVTGSSHSILILDICFFAFDKDVNKVEECWVKAPFTGTLHICILT